MNEGPIKITIDRDGGLAGGPLRATVSGLNAIPSAVLNAAEYYGGGEFTVRDEEGKMLFRLTYEWLEEDA